MSSIASSQPMSEQGRGRTFVLLLVAFTLICLVVLGILIPDSRNYPSALKYSIKEPIDAFSDWLTFESAIRPVFFNPLSDLIEQGLKLLEGILLAIPWSALVIAVVVIAWGTSGWRIALFSLLGLLFMAFIGLWQSAISTLTLMAISVAISLLIGIPLGILAGKNDNAERVLRPIIDTMQTMPPFVYLIPIMMLFGLGMVAGVFATIIYSIPPAIRLTNLGIRQVDPEAIEASVASGATPLQTLIKVELPLAIPSIMMGINQTIMMALSMVIIAALVGARGLGADVWAALRRIQVGKGLEGGLAIVFMAIILDRISYALSEDRARGSNPQGQNERSDVIAILKQHRITLIGLALFGAAFLAGRWIPALDTIPTAWQFSFSAPVDQIVSWMNINLFEMTSWLHRSLYHFVLAPLRNLLLWLPWSAILVLVTGTAWLLAGRRVALFSFLGLVIVGMLGQWDFAMDTLSQVFIAVLLSILLAIPLGILSARSNAFEAFLRPILDTLQTMPSFVYLIPVVMLFGVGTVSGLIATVVYAIAPGIRLTNLGIRQVSREAVEAADSLGSTSWQKLIKIELPLALPSIMMGLNQTIMMALAMVIVTALIGATGLGLEVLLSIGRLQTGRGFESSVAIVLLAMILDRITQSMSQKQRAMIKS